ncbi:hypothetical protein J8281_15390 [Aquimarina sp. U1-2]|uniref:hypothetical protein n=1 Tax=Aquimarina sp. U1-2 TaxID=2823141 RepID=UPI001AECE33E|nr:hypothetical protein [Aquimarina sp. U1-2]MBP2833578.1 hypothetical protein [Aquimarina sp. U1-2]
MKIRVLLILVIVVTKTFSQVSVSSKHYGKVGKIDSKTFQRFKNTTTVFVLSKFYDQEAYKAILNEVWTVTPYIIADINNFNIEDYLNDDNSIVHIGAFQKEITRKSGSISIRRYIYIDFNMYDNEKILDKLKNITSKQKERKFQKILNKYEIPIARFYIYPKGDAWGDIDKVINDKIVITKSKIYSDDMFYNYNPGFLKNYFQKVNSLIESEQEYWLYDNSYLPELKNLSTTKLFVPSYLDNKINPTFYIPVGDKKEDYISKLFKNYTFEYEVMSEEHISAKILKGEEFYYVRYARMNSERFLEVVNSKTGEIIYRDYITGLSSNLKPKHIEDLKKKISKAIKKNN